jgi:hypothetical protein
MIRQNHPHDSRKTHDEDDVFERINFPPSDLDAPHAPLVIRFDPSFVDFDPVHSRDQLSNGFYETSFRTFIDGLDRSLDGLKIEAIPLDGSDR